MLMRRNWSTNTVGENVKWDNHSGKQPGSVFKKKSKHATTIQPGNCSLKYLSPRNEDLLVHAQQSMRSNVHNFFIL